MPRYKRSAAEAQLDISLEPQPDPKDAETLSKLRNMWEFASLMQYIFMFGHVVKIDDDFDVEVHTKPPGTPHSLPCAMLGACVDGC